MKANEVADIFETFCSLMIVTQRGSIPKKNPWKKKVIRYIPYPGLVKLTRAIDKSVERRVARMRKIFLLFIRVEIYPISGAEIRRPIKNTP